MALKTMYPPINNGTPTTLDAAIDGNVTTIQLADTSVLPAGSNILSIGTQDDEVELVLYTAISGSTLTGCVRGYNGTLPQSWPAGTIAYRVFTAADHQALIDNVEALEEGKLDRTGDASNTTAAFTQATSRNNLVSKEKLSILLGKVMKWFSDLKAPAFANFGTSVNDVATGQHAAQHKTDGADALKAPDIGGLPLSGGTEAPMNGPIVSNATTMLRGSYGGNNDVLLQQDSGGVYILLTDTPGGSFNSQRPFTISKSTGGVSIRTSLLASALTMSNAAAYTAFRRSAGMGEELWSGSLAIGGSIAIANIGNYNAFAIVFDHSGGACAPAVFNQSRTGITGGGFMGYDAAGLHRSFYCTLLVSGTTVTYSAGSRMDHLASGAHSGISTDLTITRIIGIA